MRNTKLAVLAVVAMAVVALGQIPRDGLLAQYMFTSGSLVDSSSNGRDLQYYLGQTAVPVKTADRDMTPNNAYHWQFNLSVPFMSDDSGLPIGSSDRTIAFWCSMSRTADSCQNMVSWGTDRFGSYRTTSFSVVFSHDSLSIQQGNVRMASYKVTRTDFPAGGTYNEPWTHVAITIEAGTVKWYINGTIKATKQILELTTVASNYLLIGGFNPRYLQGKLDEVVIYDRPLESSEVRRLYEPQITSVKRTPTIKPTTRTTMKNYRVVLNGRTLPSATLTTATSLRVIER